MQFLLQNIQPSLVYTSYPREVQSDISEVGHEGAARGTDRGNVWLYRPWIGGITFFFMYFPGPGPFRTRQGPVRDPSGSLRTFHILPDPSEPFAILVPRDEYDQKWQYIHTVPRDVLVIQSHLSKFKVTKGSEGSGRIWRVLMGPDGSLTGPEGSWSREIHEKECNTSYPRLVQSDISSVGPSGARSAGWICVSTYWYFYKNPRTSHIWMGNEDKHNI